MDKVRIDKWLWAARFYRTRGLAKKAIEGGKVHVDSQRIKPSKDITIGQTILLRQGWDEKTVVVEALSDQRRGASEATLLYTETADSVEQRQRLSAQRKAGRSGLQPSDHKPTKKERRQIRQLRDQDLG